MPELPRREAAIPPVPPPKRHPYNQWAPDARALDIVGDKWTLLIVRDLATGPRRFVELQRTLPGISTEQLRSRLNRMVADDLLTRVRYREVPPRVDYELTERARALLPVVGAVARWGWQWAWGAPAEAEQVDVGAILRVLPGLDLGPEVEGTVEVVVERPTGARHHVLEVEGGRVTITEGEAEQADARLRGPEAAWVDALGPAAERGGLQLDGDDDLAAAFLDALAPVAARAATVA
ncbi:helix-turn-helix domain-containing protein [Conexibacter sp. SYSU D00693]|uniref:winged helix-turn-helix transcriptional regulator n=1 Tax=Conexibacter sp. SYSU D00693 TaxID=2812560 RepID=UPI00196B5A82|nr:helix-turn-helix domain-containing protein [Conexibacter sp. SYSU D00693]